MRHLLRQTIRFGDTDPAGIVFYPRFFELFHEAFEGFFDLGAGVPYASIVATERLGFPTVHVEGDFRVPLRHGEVVDIAISVTAIGEKSFTCRYDVERAGTLCAQASITTAVVDLTTFAPTPLPARYRTFLAGYLADA